MQLEIWCNRIIRVGFIVLFSFVPLLVTPWNYELFEYNKMMAVYALVVVIVGAWMIKSIAKGEFRIARTPLDIPILLFVSSQFVSSLFSIDPHVSWLGYYSRFNGGMFSVISYVLLYYAFVSNFITHPVPDDSQKLKTLSTGWRAKVNTLSQNLKSVWAIEQSDPSILLGVSNITILLKIALATGIVVALYGVAERLGIDKHLWVQDVQSRVFSTLGQPNWLAAYLVALVPLMWYFTLKSQISKSSAFWVLMATLFALVLLFTRSRSGLFGFAVADIVFWGLVFWNFTRHRLVGLQGDALKRASLPFLLLHFAFFLVIFFNGAHIDSLDRFLTFQGLQQTLSPKTNNEKRLPTQAGITNNESTPSGTLLETGGTESGTIRKYVWQGAINAWNSSWKTRLIGTGTETFAFAFYQYKPKAHNLTSEWDYLYNKAHNEYLNYLATTGLFGLGSYLLFIGAFIVWFIKNVHGSWLFVHSKKENLSAMNSALFAGWLSILVTNFFGFSVVIVQLFFFLFPGLIIISSQQCNNVAMKKLRLPQWIILLPVIGCLILLITIGFSWYADTLFAAGLRYGRINQYGRAELLMTRATALNPVEPLYRDELAMVLAGLTESAIEEKQATAAALLAKKALSESDMALSISPNNVNYWKTRTKIFYAFSSFDPAFNSAAITALDRARELSAYDPKIPYNLAILRGRQNELDKAIELLKQTIDLKPNYRDAYYALHIFYIEAKKPDLAKQILSDYLTNVDPNDKDFTERIK